MAQRHTDLRSYIDLAVSTLRTLYDIGRDDEATRSEALRRLAALDYGSYGYFFVYDREGRNLMRSRQPELVGRDLWELRDSQGRPTIQRLIARARDGSGCAEYEWRKPSNEQMTPKLGYVMALPCWKWMRRARSCSRRKTSAAASRASSTTAPARRRCRPNC